MSLYIIGSASRITCNIIHQLAKNKQYSSIILADLLPSYDFHHRFYRLQRQIQNLQYDTKLNLDKLTILNDLKKQQKYDDLLFVTHDYYTSITSKTKLMVQTVTACKNRKNLYFATPVEYDHFGYQNPQQNYTQSQKKVLQLNPNSTFIRSDVQDQTQTIAYYNSQKKNYLEKHVFQQKFYFRPQIVKANDYARIVCEILKKKVQGKKFIVRGEEVKDAFYGNFNKDISKEQYEHAKENILNLAQKYSSLHFNGYQQFQPKSISQAK